ncbi:Zinc finger C2H2-type [Trinorchestia longiramus]|nr:Zinc finger C2H2-type [Trinorchestia longiramus]
MSSPSPTPPTRHHLLHSHHNSHHPHHSSANSSTTISNVSSKNCSASSPASNNLDSLEDKHSLKMKIKRTKPPTKTSEAKHEIVKPLENDNSDSSAQNHNQVPHNSVVSSPANLHLSLNSNTQVDANGSSHSLSRQNVVKHNHKKEKRRHDVNGSVQSINSQQHQLGALHNSSPKHPQLQQMAPLSSAAGVSQCPQMPTACLTPTTNPKQAVTPIKSNSIPTAAAPQHTPLRTDALPPAKRLKIGEEVSGPSYAGAGGTNYRDVCVGTSVGTITEPDCLGPCEPGTSVTLEGIVWHETQGGVLVVNVTWRGKTYVGTLLDCTQHDWAPPRFCDSPSTEDMDSRTPKGRGKRGRYGGSSVQTSQANANSGTTGAGPGASGGTGNGTCGTNQTLVNTPVTSSISELSNVTETRSGKVRGNQPQKGRRGGGNSNFATPNSPQNAVTSKRKVRDTDSNDVKNKRRVCGKQGDGSTENSIDDSPSVSQSSEEVPSYTVSSPAQSPQYIECPEPNCSKKYKHVNGLKYHQNHAHNSAEEEGCQGDGDDASNPNIASEDGCSEPINSVDASEESSHSKSSNSNCASELTGSSFGNYSNRSSPVLINNAVSSAEPSGMAATRDVSSIHHKPSPSSRLVAAVSQAAPSMEDQHQSAKYEQFTHGQCQKPPIYQQRGVPHSLVSQPSPYHPPHQDGALVTEQTYSSIPAIYSHSNASPGYALSTPVVSHAPLNNHPSSSMQNPSCPGGENIHSSVIARLPTPSHPMYYYPPNTSALGIQAGAIRPNPVVRPGVLGSSVQVRPPAPHVIANTTPVSSSPRPTILLSTPENSHIASLPGSPLVKNGANKTTRENGEEEDPRSPAYSDISDAADAPSMDGEASNSNSTDRKDNQGKPEQLLIQPGSSFVGLNVYGGFENSFSGHSPYILRYNPSHSLNKLESKENCKTGEEKKEVQESTNFQPSQTSFPSGMYPYAGGLAPPPHYTSDPYYAHLAHSMPGVPPASSVDVNHPPNKDGTGANVSLSAPKLGSGGPYQASLDPRILHPLLSTGLPMPVALSHPVDNVHGSDTEAGPLSLEKKHDSSTSEVDNRDGPNSLDVPPSSSGGSFSQT